MYFAQADAGPRRGSSPSSTPHSFRRCLVADAAGTTAGQLLAWGSRTCGHRFALPTVATALHITARGAAGGPQFRRLGAAQCTSRFGTEKPACGGVVFGAARGPRTPGSEGQVTGVPDTHCDGTDAPRRRTVTFRF